MKVELFPFQKTAVYDLRMKIVEAMGGYYRTHAPQVISFTAPTGAGKTIIMAALIERILFGDEFIPEQQDAIFIWLSDSPQLNEQSKLKIDLKADKIRLGQCVTVTDESFDQEFFDDGHIYFLNTQKLSKTSNLTQNGDGRTYTIWQTIANTVRAKSNRLYFIIDEAHRGMQGREASKATTIMQKFIKGSKEDKIPAMPIVIGMSATTARFNKLVEGTTSTIHKSVVTSDEVRSSGLLKDRIVITYPEESTLNKDMAVLQAAADDWKEKWDHWNQYCREQHYAYVNPVFVIQVLSGSGKKISDTDLDDCIQKVEERVGYKFEKGQVVHTFGSPSSSIKANGLDVPYVEPSKISEDRNIRVVLFKESLSTGWDCPRAETMMSFRHAVDATYIAQLLGRMIRTPMQMHIQVDDILNDVHLYLPYFDHDTVKKVVEELQNAEGGDIPADIYGETVDTPKYATYSVKPCQNKAKPVKDTPGQMKMSDYNPGGSLKNQSEVTNDSVDTAEESSQPLGANQNNYSAQKDDTVTASDNNTSEETNTFDYDKSEPDENEFEDLFDREEVMKFINDLGILTYDIRTVRIHNYLTSLFKMTHLLTQNELNINAVKDVHADIILIIHDYVEALKSAGKYDELVTEVKQFKLQSQIFDTFGETMDNYSVHDLFSTTDTDIDCQLRLAESKLSGEGIGTSYGKAYIDVTDPNAYKIDVILFVANSECMDNLQEYAKLKFHSLHDEYRRKIALLKSDIIRQQYDRIVSDGDIISEHCFRLPEDIKVSEDKNGKEYSNHLFVNPITRNAKFNLDSWETGVIAEEAKADDFVCWIRNPSRGSWALTIPYEIDDEKKPLYPDFIIVRKDVEARYIIDILEPHGDQFADNINKAKGLADYANKNPGIGRIQLIREVKDSIGNKKYKRLDMSKSLVRDKVIKATNNDELNHIFDTDGFYM